MWRVILSSMTMASSTTKPTDSVNASSVMLLIRKSNTYIAAGADQRHRHRQRGDDGRGNRAQEQEDHHHDQGDRDRQRLLHVHDQVANGDRAVVEHLHADRRRDHRAVLRQTSRTRSTTATVLASGWRWMASTMARLSLNQLAILSFSTLSMTRD